MAEREIFTTSDGIQIVGLFKRNNDQKFAILLHMMPETKESWALWQEKLDEAGYASLAIDERGHGESAMGGTLSYKKFTDAEQQAKILDVEAAFADLASQGAVEGKTVVIGASIGANLAIEYLAQHPNIPVAIALSPGLNYHGILTEPFVQVLSPDQRLILVASDDDPESFQAIERLHELAPEQTVILKQTGLGHGTAMTDADPSLIDEIIQWLP